VRDFGENYVREGVEKIRELSSLGLTWHYIGPIQSNKTRAIAEHFDWVHSVVAKKSRAARTGARPRAERASGLHPGQRVARRPRAAWISAQSAQLAKQMQRCRA